MIFKTFPYLCGMKNNKTTIHEFDPCIYPRLLWVVKGGTLEGIKDIFDTDIEEEDGGAVTFPVRRKVDNRLGYCVWFPKSCDIRNLDWIAHESSHVALCIFNDVGAVITNEGQEPFAYLVGWVFKCINEVRKFKEVKNGIDTSEQGSSEKIQLETPCESA